MNGSSWELLVYSDHIIIYPLNDTSDHLIHSPGCPCEPRVEYDNEGIRPIYIHNSFDGREAVEMANEILKQ